MGLTPFLALGLCAILFQDVHAVALEVAEPVPVDQLQVELERPVFREGFCPNGAPNRLCSQKGIACPGGYTCDLYPGSSAGECCPSRLFAKLCTFEDDLKKDYLWFIDMHKDILDELPGVGKPEERKKMDEIWGLIDCINDLICKLNDKKKAIMNYECELNGWTFMRIWIEYIWTILDKSNSLDLAVSDLKKMINGNENGLRLAVEFDRQVTTCPFKAMIGPLECYVKEAEMLLQMDDSRSKRAIVPVSDDPLTNICNKIRKLRILCSQLFGKLITLFWRLWKMFISRGRPDLFPINWIWQMFKCILQICRLSHKLEECCNNNSNIKLTSRFLFPDINQSVMVKNLDATHLDFSPFQTGLYQSTASNPDRAKCISKWLTEAMAVRESIRGCFPKNPAKKLVKEIKKLGTDDEVKAWMAETNKFAKKAFKGVLNDFDECIRFIRCQYLEYVASWWGARF